jgi:hypothetical protein
MSNPTRERAREIEANFDLRYHLKHVDVIFARVFGAAPKAKSSARSPLPTSLESDPFRLNQNST